MSVPIMRMIRSFSALLSLLAPTLCHSQVQDDFSDGNFTSTPVWVGDTAQFSISTGLELQSEGPNATETLSLATASTLVDDVEWRVNVRFNAAPSTANFVRIYLISDRPGLEGALNGYYIGLGEAGSDDSIDLFRQDSVSSVKIIDGIAGQVATRINVSLRIIRSAKGNWEVYADPQGGNNLQLQGIVTDTVHSRSTHLGVLVRHSSTRRRDYFFDNFFAGPLARDITPPEIVQSTVVNDKELELLFSESVDSIAASQTANYLANLGLGSPATAIRDSENPALVRLSFAQGFTPNISYQLLVNNIPDLAGNFPAAAQVVNFTYQVAIKAVFNDVIINEIMADPSPQVALPNAEYIELFNRSANPLNLENWTLSNGSTVGRLPAFTLNPGGYVILTPANTAALFNGLGSVISPNVWPALSNSLDNLGLRNAEKILIDSVNYDIAWYRDGEKNDGGYSLERINPESSVCAPASNWIASNSPRGGTPGAQNSVFSTQTDQIAPVLQSADLITNDTLRICFNESMDPSELINRSNYQVNNGLSISGIQADGSDFSCVKITFSPALQQGIAYTLTANNLKDCSGNPTSAPVQTVFSKVVSQPVVAGDIIINEIMADPTPPRGLPDAEYIELFNRSDKVINLENWTLSNGSTIGRLPAFTLNPASYVLLTPLANAGSFAGRGSVISPSAWPALTNGGDDLGLRSANKILIDSVNYTLSWYRDASKSAGGYSLELINPNNVSCAPVSNWIASTATAGGTPGAQNSVFSTALDRTAPLLTSVQLKGTDTLQVCFDESMDAPTLRNLSNFRLDNGASIISALPIGPDFLCVKLVANAAFQPGTTYTLTVQNVADCKGNIATGQQTRTFSRIIATPASFKDVIINEILPDPSPQVGLPDAEFIELYNRSTGNINLENWTLSNGSTVGELPTFILEPGKYVILTQAASAALFSNLGAVISPSAWPALTNSGDNIGLRSADKTLIDTLDYSISWYRDLVKDDGGYSLELINPNNLDCAPISNWIASNATAGGTPGIQNSVYSIAGDQTAPQLDRVEVLSPDSARICFNESMNALDLANVNNYQLSGGIRINIARPVGPDFQCVVIFFSAPLQAGVSYSLLIDDVADCSGNSNESVLTASLITGEIAGRKDIIFNEVFADETPQIGLPASEYIELYNRSQKAIDLSGWTLSNGTTVGRLPALLLAAGEYIILAPANSLTLFTTGGRKAISPSAWPALGNNEDNLGLRNATGLLIDTLDYDISWYRDAIKDNGGYSLELINPDNFGCAPVSNWIASESPSGGTPGLQNSVFSTAADQTPPKYDELEIVSPTNIKVCFDESMDPESLERVENYQISNGIAVSRAVAIAPDYLCVELTLNAGLQTGIEYNLLVRNVTDCSENVIAQEINVPLVIGERPEAFDVIITEIFPDPSPRVGLPDAEFIEIYNRTDKTLDISNWGLQDGSSSSKWDNAKLGPKEYAIICDVDNEEAFQAFGKVIAMRSFPSLGNTNDSLLLLNDLGFTIDYVFYSDDWYKNEVKSEGGFTLERIDSEFLDCNNSGNWTASTNSNGGTPGTVNSKAGTFTDNIPPRVTGLRIIDQTTVEIQFSEQMNAETLQLGSSYEISPQIGNPLLGFPVPPAFQAVRLLLLTPIDSQTIYTIRYTGISDCAGNALSGTTRFAIPVPIDSGDVLINELLFNPYSGGSDFVEVINVSEKVLDLKELFVGEILPGTDSIDNAHQVAEETVLLLPGEIICLTRNVAHQQQTYQTPDTARFYQMRSFPSYDDDEGECIIFTNTVRLDRFAYLDDLHFPTLESDEGVSLERVSLEVPSQALGNWHSASSIVRYATPGYANSQVISPPPSGQPEFTNGVSLPKQTFSPNGDGVDEVLSINYNFDFIGANARISIYDTNGRLIKVLRQNTLLDPKPGTFFWDGRDEGNNKANIGMYIIYFEITDQRDGSRKAYKQVAVLADVF